MEGYSIIRSFYLTLFFDTIYTNQIFYERDLPMPNKQDTTLNFWWLDSSEKVGKRLFTFDGKTVFNLFRDYPQALTEEQKRVFDELNPYWKEFFKNKKS